MAAELLPSKVTEALLALSEAAIENGLRLVKVSLHRDVHNMTPITLHTAGGPVTVYRET